MTRTPLNCSLIKKSIKDGIGGPEYSVNNDGTYSCEGYQVSRIDDEPYETCKCCKHCIFSDE